MEAILFTEIATTILGVYYVLKVYDMLYFCII